jgi:hypothetical protein
MGTFISALGANTLPVPLRRCHYIGANALSVPIHRAAWYPPKNKITMQEQEANLRYYPKRHGSPQRNRIIMLETRGEHEIGDALSSAEFARYSPQQCYRHNHRGTGPDWHKEDPTHFFGLEKGLLFGVRTSRFTYEIGCSHNQFSPPSLRCYVAGAERSPPPVPGRHFCKDLYER